VIRFLALWLVLPGLSWSFDYTYGYTGNAALWGNSWDMSSGVLGVNAVGGMDISGVIYNYTAVKDKEDDFVVTVQNKDTEGGYIFQEVDDWSGTYGMRIRKVVSLPYVPIARFGKGEIATTGTGSIEDANVIYMYRFDACFDPQSDPSCAGYVKPLPVAPVIPVIIIYDALDDENVKDATKETDRDLIEEVEEEKNDDEEEEDEDRLEMALASSTNALTIANQATQGSVVRAMNTATNITNYYVAKIAGGTYKETTSLFGGDIVDNKRVFRDLTQDKLHNQMVEEQYK